MTLKYTVVWDNKYSRFCQTVDERMREGWVCQGGVSVDSSSGAHKYAQAMIFYDEIPALDAMSER